MLKFERGWPAFCWVVCVQVSMFVRVCPSLFVCVCVCGKTLPSLLLGVCEVVSVVSVFSSGSHRVGGLVVLRVVVLWERSTSCFHHA